VKFINTLNVFKIMEKRYEIREKIGQGGLGAVYRGYDIRMSRDIAIKRISVANDDPELQEESTRQLVKEAGALASLQHPHIVTIYDVGSDQDGPYVVMELISGKTLDELIERAPLTWTDFRELAVQTMEALIAAHELGMIHGDIKPTNLMLTWLPSGKFQMKIVDFGLATLTHSQSLEELQVIDAVFGSISFMAPEQFERIPLDSRTDLYAMGCVYYHALTGSYPFKGDTTHEVMVAHLHHQVIALQDVRSAIPLWVCDWIMWMINRTPTDRPASAREALQVFFQNDKIPKPTLSRGNVPQKTTPAGRPQAPTPTKPRPAASASVAPPEEASLASKGIKAPQPLLPPDGSKPSIYTTPHQIPDTLPTPTAPHTVLQTRHYTPAPEIANSRKLAKLAIRVFASILILALGFAIIYRIKQSRASQRYEVMIAEATKNGATEIPMSGPEFQHLLAAAADANTDELQKNIFKLLLVAKANDGANLEASLTEFATKSTQLLPEAREAMIHLVLEPRVNNSMIPALVEFVRSTPDIPSAVAALQAIRSKVGDNQFEPLFLIVQFHPREELRLAAESSLMEILKKSSKRGEFLQLIQQARLSIPDNKVRKSLVRLEAIN
jgi:serine/threonine protein kinase